MATRQIDNKAIRLTLSIADLTEVLGYSLSLALRKKIEIAMIRGGN